jgi:hypothetical protein
MYVDINRANDCEPMSCGFLNEMDKCVRNVKDFFKFFINFVKVVKNEKKNWVFILKKNSLPFL